MTQIITIGEDFRGNMEITVEKNIHGGYILKYYMKPDYPIERAYQYGYSLKVAIKLFKNYIKEEEESIFVNQ